jgi:phosphatidylglycerophosphatase C
VTAVPTVVAFDVDGTITTRDCVVPFLRRIAGTGLAVGLVRRSGRLLAALARRDRDALKALAAEAAFRGRSCDAVRAEGAAFADDVADRWLDASTMEHLRRHLEEGDDVVMVSASFDVYLEPLAARLGVPTVLGTRLVCHDGCLTGDLDGVNCRGPEKVARLHAWLDERHGGRSRVRLVAYGDSPGDRELLADADEAVWVGRRGRAS